MGGVKFCLFNIRYIDIDWNPTFCVPNISMTRDLLPHELVLHPGSIKCRTSAVKSHRTGRSWYLGESYIEYFCDSIQMGVHRITVVWLSSVVALPLSVFLQNQKKLDLDSKARNLIFGSVPSGYRQAHLGGYRYGRILQNVGCSGNHNSN